MNQERKDKKKIVIICICLIAIIGIITCIILTLNNNKSTTTKKNNTTKSKSIESITKGGTYKLSGNYECVNINTSEKVELDLDGANITCDGAPAINVEEGNLSIVLNGKNSITSTTTESLDGAIYSKDDITFSGDGSIEIKSNYDAIVSKDSLVINGGTYTINSDDDGIRGKDIVDITNGTFNITTVGDAIKATNDEDATLGNVKISGGTFNIKTTGTDTAKGIKAESLIEISDGTFDINTSDDSIHSNGNITINGGTYTINSKDDGTHADGLVEMNDGTFKIDSSEGIEGTYVKINGGDINISASDDGINATNKSTNYDVSVEINGGNLTIKMGQGDTDGIDSNGTLYINGGTINITAQSPFDYDKEAKYTSGTMIINGEKTTTITNQMMGGGPMGNNRGQMNPQDNNQNNRMNRGFRNR